MLDSDMATNVAKFILPLLKSHDQISSASAKMTSIPNIGFFLVIPRAVINSPPEYFANTMGWKYCFDQRTSEGPMAFFKNTTTQEYEDRYGDIQS